MKIDDVEANVGEVALTLDAVLIYEDLGTGMRAKYVLECAARLFPMAPHVNVAMWRFDLMRAAKVREMALKAASGAALVLLSARGSGAWPRAVKAWVQRWLERKSDQPCALVVSLDESAREIASAGKMISWLQAAAKAKDVEVFPCFGMTPFSEGDPVVEVLPTRLSTNRAAWDNSRRWPDGHSYWGINE